MNECAKLQMREDHQKHLPWLQSQTTSKISLEIIHVGIMISLTEVQWDRRAKSSFKDAKHHPRCKKATKTEWWGLE